MKLTLTGAKTYIIGVLLIIFAVSTAFYGKITTEQFLSIATLLIGAGFMTTRAAISKVEKLNNNNGKEKEDVS